MWAGTTAVTSILKQEYEMDNIPKNNAASAKYSLMDMRKILLKIVLPVAALALYYSYFFYPALGFFNQERHVNEAYIVVVIFVLASMHGVLLAILHAKKYDVVFLLAYKLFSYFPCLFYAAVIEDRMINRHSLTIFASAKNAMAVLANSYLTWPLSENLFLHITKMFWPLPIYIAISIVPFVLARMVKEAVIAEK